MPKYRFEEYRVYSDGPFRQAASRLKPLVPTKYTGAFNEGVQYTLELGRAPLGTYKGYEWSLEHSLFGGARLIVAPSNRSLSLKDTLELESRCFPKGIPDGLVAWPLTYDQSIGDRVDSNIQAGCHWADGLE